MDNVLCPLASDTRAFNTPRLEPGRQYFYNLRAEVTRDGQTVSQNRRILLSAGQQVEVDFQEMAAVTSANR